MKKRCAIYTRKSTDERLDMEFNTLDAQREACEAYIVSQKSEGWIISTDHYDDGGFSGGSLERPALNKLLDDIKAGKIQIIVVYKIDRLTRSLMDFAKLVEIFDQYGVTFVSITHSFNTTTSMGRLTLNVLLSFAQFEREVASERIRDKIAASKAKGMWMGSRPPLGFDIKDRKLVSNDDAGTAKLIFELYLELGCVRKLKQELEKRGIKSKERISEKGLKYGGQFFSRGALYSLLQNPVYIGKISHKGEIHDGLHEAIISDELWDTVQQRLSEQAPHTRGVKKQSHKNLLTNLIFDDKGNPYTPVYTNKGKKKYRYYLNEKLNHDPEHPDKLRSRLPAHEIETLLEKSVRDQIQKLCGETHKPILDHVVKFQHEIPTYEFIRTCVKRITVYFDQIQIQLKPTIFPKLVDKHLGVSITGIVEVYEIVIPYQTKRVKDGAIIFEPKGRDIFDLPPADLKKLVQGVIWRDEHFSGTKMSDIAKREGNSDRYIRKVIMRSFDTLLSA
ncbi:MAG: recombinase family protein [Alphaproteobacteria bacterium]|nr:recombinase family protein [Alphaproteobacteria bacterium]